MRKRMNRLSSLTLTIPTLLGLQAVLSFVPPIPSPLRSKTPSPWTQFQFKTSDDNGGRAELETQSSVILPTNRGTDRIKEDNAPLLSATVPIQEKKRETKNIVLPSSVTTAAKNESQRKSNSLQQRINRVTAKLGKLRPGQKFRVGLGLAALASLSLTSLVVPPAKWLGLTTRWIGHRGFQGLSALGRTVAYGWAVLVAYPRLLDRRASERRQRERERKLERRRSELFSLAAEVSRLRQELRSIDAEIRSFRREIISLKALAQTDNSSNPDVQEAINAEMAHLAQLRSDTQAALAAARQTWAEARSQSPPEAWPGSMPPY